MKDIKKSLILFCLGFFLLAVYGAQGVNEQPKIVDIEIEVSATGEIRCPYAEAKTKQQVIWHCAHDFALDFGQRTPFDEFKFSSGKPDKFVKGWGKSKKIEILNAVWPTVTFQPPPNEIVKFKYFVVVLYNGKILTLDPELGIKP